MMLGCHCPQLGVLWDGFGVEQSQRSRAPLLKTIPCPGILPEFKPKGAQAVSHHSVLTVAVSHWELGSPGQDVAVFPKPLWEFRAGSGTRCPPSLEGAAGPGSCLESRLIPGLAGSICGGCVQQPRLQGEVLGRVQGEDLNARSGFNTWEDSQRCVAL